MKAIRMMTKDANMGDKKSTENNPQTEHHNTQPFSAPNPPSTVKVQEETETEQKVLDSFQQSEFPQTELYQEIWPG